MRKTPLKSQLENDAPLAAHGYDFRHAGFMAFDLIHIAAALAMFVAAIAQWGNPLEPITAATEIIKAGVELFMGLLLIFFHRFVATTHGGPLENVFYNFCWLIASLAVALADSFNLIELLESDSGIYATLLVVETSLAFVALGLVSIGLFLREKKRGWMILLVMASAILTLSAGTTIVRIIIELFSTGFHVLRFLHMLAAVAPFIPLFYIIADAKGFLSVNKDYSE